MVVKEMVSGNVYTIQIMPNITGSSLGTMPPTESLGDIPLADGQEQHNNDEDEVSDQSKSNNWWDALGLLTKSKEEKPTELDMWIGETLPPLSDKLVTRILRWEFIEMAELRPYVESEITAVRGQTSQNVKKQPVTDILTWLQCFGIYVGVLAKQYPEAVSELMAYMVVIIKASQRYAGLAWVNYDTLYRRQAAAKKCRVWSQTNTSLFNLCFTGQLKDIEQCHQCGTVSHTSSDCPQRNEGEENVPARLLHSLETVAAALTSRSGHFNSQKGEEFGRRKNTGICNKYNEQNCHYAWCRYRHVCLLCGGNHPKTLCDQSKGKGGAKFRSGKPRPYGPY